MKNILLTLLFAISCTQLNLKKEEKVRITILHTNDHHGRFWKNNDGEYGLSARATLIKKISEEIKSQGGDVLILDAGDVNTGIPQSDLQLAEPDFRGMSLIGYDAMALGNHEFDHSLDVIFKQQKDWAKFPFLSANIYDKNKKRIFPSHITKNIQGMNVTILGLTTEDTPYKSKPSNSKGLVFRPAVEEAIEIVPKLKENADLLIAVTHTGHYPNETHGIDAPGDVTIARRAPGIDIIIGGHTQKPLFKPDLQNGTYIVQAYEWGKYVGRIDLEISKNNKMKMLNYELIPINLKGSNTILAADAQMESLLAPFKKVGDQRVLIPVGKSVGEFQGQRDIIRAQETNLGNLVCDAYRTKLKADIGLSNSGGIRDSIRPGKITLETILMVLPFGGEIVRAELKGSELKTYLEFIAQNMSKGSGGFPQFSGVKITLHKLTKKLKSIQIHGKALAEEKTYSIALPEFIANGGDKYPAIKSRKYGFIDADILKEFIQAKTPIKSENFTPTQDIVLE